MKKMILLVPATAMAFICSENALEESGLPSMHMATVYACGSIFARRRLPSACKICSICAGEGFCGAFSSFTSVMVKRAKRA